MPEKIPEILTLLGRGAREEALSLCRRELSVDPDNLQLLTAAGEIEQSRGMHAAAAELFRRASLVSPQDAATWRRLGFAELESGRYEYALRALRVALGLDPGSTRALNNSGRALFLLDRHEEAREFFQRVLGLDPGNAIAHLNLGLILLRRGEDSGALSQFQKSAESNPRLVNAWSAQAEVLLRQGSSEQALYCADKALLLEPQLVAALTARARALYELKRYGESLQSSDRLLSLRPSDDSAHFSRGRILRAMGDKPGALAEFREALNLNPKNHAALWSAMVSTIPVVCESTAELTRSRLEFEQAIREVTDHLGSFPCDDPTLMVGVSHPFYLAYHPSNNRELLSRYGDICSEQMLGRKEACKWIPRNKAEALRVGFVSAHICSHSVFDAITRGWITGLAQLGIELNVFHLGRQNDACTAEARSRATRFEQGVRSSQQWASIIAAAACDILIYPEIGMHECSIQLASMRLAPVQCVAWGHPETSGLPTIDYFLSADALEPTDAGAHYREKLVRLPNLGVYFEPPVRGASGLTRGQESASERSVHRLLCPGTPYKYLPEHDGVLLEIARRLERCRFTFFSYEDGSLTRRVLGRISRRFSDAGLDPAEFLECRPWMTASDFHVLMQSSHLMLDTIGFSGFNTVMHALQEGLPVVTHRGSFLRGRLGSGIMEKLGLDALVAESPRDYVDKVVQITRDSVLRAELRDSIGARLHLLYRDVTPVRALHSFLQSVR